jgi:hypothetical protein
MPPRSRRQPVPAPWQPLVSQSEWTTVYELLGDDPTALADLRVRLDRLTTRDRRLLLRNLARSAAPAADGGPHQAIFHAFAITFDELVLRSAEQLAHDEDAYGDASSAEVVELPSRKDA